MSHTTLRALYLQNNKCQFDSEWFVPLDPKPTPIAVDVFLSCHIFLWRIPPRAFSSQNIACDVCRTRFRLAVYTQIFCERNSCAICMSIKANKVIKLPKHARNNKDSMIFINEIYIPISLKLQLFTTLSLSILHSDCTFFRAKNTSGSWKHSAVDSLKVSSVVSEIVMLLKNRHCLIRPLWL